MRAGACCPETNLSQKCIKFMKKIILICFAVALLALFTGCETQDEQVQHTQDRKQQMLMKEMQKEQDQANQNPQLQQE